MLSDKPHWKHNLCGRGKKSTHFVIFSSIELSLLDHDVVRWPKFPWLFQTQFQLVDENISKKSEGPVFNEIHLVWLSTDTMIIRSSTQLPLTSDFYVAHCFMKPVDQSRWNAVCKVLAQAQLKRLKSFLRQVSLKNPPDSGRQKVSLLSEATSINYVLM